MVLDIVRTARMVDTMCPSDADAPGTRYGLQFKQGSWLVRLIQTSGAGRLLLMSHDKQWWALPPLVEWEVCEAETGQLYATKDSANEVAHTLSNLARGRHGGVRRRSKEAGEGN
jgi:hypothetical protein